MLSSCEPCDVSKHTEPPGFQCLDVFSASITDRWAGAFGNFQFQLVDRHRLPNCHIFEQLHQIMSLQTSIHLTQAESNRIQQRCISIKIHLNWRPTWQPQNRRIYWVPQLSGKAWQTHMKMHEAHGRHLIPPPHPRLIQVTGTPCSSHLIFKSAAVMLAKLLHSSATKAADWASPKRLTGIPIFTLVATQLEPAMAPLYWWLMWTSKLAGAPWQQSQKVERPSSQWTVGHSVRYRGSWKLRLLSC